MTQAPSPDDRTLIRPATGSAAEGPGAADRSMALRVGTRLGEFEITSRLGEGGFGVVYRAWDHSLEREVAVKEYLPSAIATRLGETQIGCRSERHQETFDAGLKSFINEAKLLARFDHPSLVKVYRFWEAHGTAYMVMPYYQGVTLRDTVRALPAPPNEQWLLGFLAPLTDALGFIHREQCYHRDIAPDNVLLLADGGRPLLLDFGAARRVIGDMTHALTVILKPGYAPVEQYAEVPGMRQGPWTDVYALAAVVYWTITGKVPPPSVGRMLSDSWVPLSQLAAGRYSAGFLAAIDRALAVRPETRTQDIATLRTEIGLDRPRPAPPAAAPAPVPVAAAPAAPAAPVAPVAEGSMVVTRPGRAPASKAPPPPPNPPAVAPPSVVPAVPQARGSPRVRPAAAAAAGAALVLLVAAAWWFTRTRPEPTPATPASVPAPAAPPVGAAPPAPAPAPATAEAPAPAPAPAPVAATSFAQAQQRWSAAADATWQVVLTSAGVVTNAAGKAVPRLGVDSTVAGHLYLLAQRAGSDEVQLWHMPGTAAAAEARRWPDLRPEAWATRPPAPGRWRVVALVLDASQDVAAAGFRPPGGLPVRRFDGRPTSDRGCLAGALPCGARFGVAAADIEVPAAAAKPPAPAGPAAECARLMQQMSLGDAGAAVVDRYRALGCR